MTAETSNARWEVVAERQAWYEQQIALAEGQWAEAFLDRWECGDDVPSKEHYVALWLAERAAPQPADAQQGQAVAECHCATCTCAPGMTPAVRFDTSPAAQEGAVRDHLIALGWTPPNTAPPPSAPVVPDWITGDGMQGIKAEAHFLTQHTDETVQRVGRRLIERVDKIIAALAQQPAAPSAPVGVEAIAAEIRASLGRGATVCTRRRWAIELEALAQQPSAVDGARGVVDVYTMQTIADAAAALDKRGDRQMAARLIRLHTRLLAAQHQEPKP